MARKNMHKQVYYHHTIRALEIVLRSIFRRISDLRSDDFIDEGIPSFFSFLIKEGGRPDLSEFLDLDDSSIFYLIKHLSIHSTDDTLRALAKLFVTRTPLSCIYDSMRPFYKYPEYNRPGPVYHEARESQADFFDQAPLLDDVLAKLRAECARLLARDGLPVELARYVVTNDSTPRFSTGLPTDFLCEVGGKVLPLIEAEKEFDFGASLLETDSFAIDRIFVPRMFEGDLARTLYGAS